MAGHTQYAILRSALDQRAVIRMISVLTPDFALGMLATGTGEDVQIAASQLQHALKYAFRVCRLSPDSILPSSCILTHSYQRQPTPIQI
jgi:hypothetical protein